MLNIAGRSTAGVLLEIDQRVGRGCRDDAYQIFADGIPVDHAATLVRAKRKANVFAGCQVFSLTEDADHACA